MGSEHLKITVFSGIFLALPDMKAHSPMAAGSVPFPLWCVSEPSVPHWENKVMCTPSACYVNDVLYKHSCVGINIDLNLFIVLQSWSPPFPDHWQIHPSNIADRLHHYITTRLHFLESHWNSIHCPVLRNPQCWMLVTPHQWTPSLLLVSPCLLMTESLLGQTLCLLCLIPMPLTLLQALPTSSWIPFLSPF